MDDYISREEALACFSDWIDRYGHEHSADEMVEYQRIEDLPAAAVRPVVRGTWEWNKHYGLYECSNCHNSYVDHEWVKERKLQFCPSCGADMREEEVTI